MLRKKSIENQKYCVLLLEFRVMMIKFWVINTRKTVQLLLWLSNQHPSADHAKKEKPK